MTMKTKKNNIRFRNSNEYSWFSKIWKKKFEMIRIPSMGYVVMGANVIAVILGGMLLLTNGAMTSEAVDVFHELVPEDISILAKPLRVLGGITIAFAACGILVVIVERWLKFSYLILIHAFLLGILAAVQIFTTVAMNKVVDNAVKAVPESLTTAFANPDLRPAFHDLEFKAIEKECPWSFLPVLLHRDQRFGMGIYSTFTVFMSCDWDCGTYMCCGTLGTSSYLSNQLPLPQTCCQLFTIMIIEVCTETNSHGGCIDGVSNGLQGLTTMYGAMIISSTVVHYINIFLSSFYFHHIRSKRYD